MALTQTNARGDAARAALIESAERLFAERGIEGVSLRDVSAAAGQKNHSAAQYHFGDRQGLVTAVYEYRMRVAEERRHAYLDEIEADGRGTDIPALVATLVVPLVEVVAEADAWYGRFLSRSRWEPNAWQAMRDVPTGDSFSIAIHRLAKQLDHLSAPVRRHRLDQLMTLIIGSIAGWEGAPDRGERRLSAEQLETELVATGVAVLMAPSSLSNAGNLTGASR